MKSCVKNPTLRAGAIAAVIAFSFAAGCQSEKQGLEFKGKYSVNLAVPEKDWPGNPKKTLTPGQQEVLDTRGKPDLVRLLWKGRDAFARRTDLPGKMDAKLVGQTEQSWVYLRQGDEIVFASPVDWRSEPIGDKLATVIREGDPEEINYVPDPTGSGEQESWHYFNSGMTYQFRDGKLSEPPRRMHPGIAWLK